MNPTTILALLTDLYEQVRVLGEENRGLRAELGTGAVPVGDKADG